MAGPRPRITAAVCAYNEAANIGQLLEVLTSRDAECFDELLVVSSGSTDGTDDIVRGFEARSPKLRLIIEPERAGKARAVNTALSLAQGDVILLLDADCLPEAGCLERLAGHFETPDVGGVGSRNVPINAREGWIARAGAVLWDLHHEVCRNRPVLGGDIVAFRAVVREIDPRTVNDDYALEAALRAAGLRIDYEAEARVRMRAPSKLRDFLNQRRRIAAGFRSDRRVGLEKATQSRLNAASAALAYLRVHPGRTPALLLLLCLEALARASVLAGSIRGREPYYTAWEPAPSTKGPISEHDAPEKAR